MGDFSDLISFGKLNPIFLDIFQNAWIFFLGGIHNKKNFSGMVCMRIFFGYRAKNLIPPLPPWRIGLRLYMASNYSLFEIRKKIIAALCNNAKMFLVFCDLYICDQLDKALT